VSRKVESAGKALVQDQDPCRQLNFHRSNGTVLVGVQPLSGWIQEKNLCLEVGGIYTYSGSRPMEGRSRRSHGS